VEPDHTESFLEELAEGTVHSDGRFSLDTGRFRARLSESSQINPSLYWTRLWQFIQLSRPSSITIQAQRHQIQFDWIPTCSLELPPPETAIRNLWDTKLDLQAGRSRPLLDTLRLLVARDEFRVKLAYPNWAVMLIQPDDLQWDCYPTRRTDGSTVAPIDEADNGRILSPSEPRSEGQTASCVISVLTNHSNRDLGLLSLLFTLDPFSPIASFRWRDFLKFRSQLVCSAQPVHYNSKQLQFGPSHPRFVERTWVVLGDRADRRLGFTRFPTPTIATHLVDGQGKAFDSDQEWDQSEGVARITTFIAWGYSTSANYAGPGSFEYEQFLFLIQDGLVVYRGQSGIPGLWIHHGIQGMALDADGQRVCEGPGLDAILLELRKLAEHLYANSQATVTEQS
jgi:hypothetical protein